MLLEPGPHPVAGCLLRGATPGAHAAFARLFVELGTGDPVPTGESFAQDQLPTTWVATHGGAVVAYLYWQLLSGAGYVRHLVVDAAWRDRGLGTAMLRHLAERMAAAGAARWHLNVKPDNARALKVYRALGMEVRYPSTALRFPWAAVEGFPAPRGGVTAYPVEPARDAAIERALGLVDGQLAQARGIPGRVLMELRDGGGAPAGVAIFNPSFPGAFPFRVWSPDLARPLLQALRPHALPGVPHMQVVVEGDEALAAMLEAQGAEVRLRVLHMDGPLPLPG